MYARLAKVRNICLSWANLTQRRFFLFWDEIKHSKKTFCLHQHIKASAVGLVWQPSQTLTMNGTVVTGESLRRGHMKPSPSFWLVHTHKHAPTHTHDLTPTRLPTCLNFTADSSRALWRLIWSLRRAASSVCVGKLQFWHRTVGTAQYRHTKHLLIFSYGLRFVLFIYFFQAQWMKSLGQCV